MGTSRASETLRALERSGTAPAGEIAVAVERGAVADAPQPEPVLLLTSRALYARRDAGWARLPLDRVSSVSVDTDPSGMLTRYRVVDGRGDVFAAVAVPRVTGTFRARLQELAAGARPTAPAAVVRASVASRASAASLASAAALAGLRAQQGRTVRVA